MVVNHVKPPQVEDGPFRMLGTILEANPYLGRIVTGRITAGSVKANQTIKVIDRNGKFVEQGRVSKVLAFRGLERQGIDEGVAGDIVSIAGLPQASVSDKPKFDFYKILPGAEEPVTDKELKDRAKAASKGQQEAAKDVYFIQTGSFQNPAEADNQKARLAILGFESSVEPTNLPDKGTWYRVRLGPYTKVDDINRVRQTLAQNGINASLVRIKEAQ